MTLTLLVSLFFHLPSLFPLFYSFLAAPLELSLLVCFILLLLYRVLSLMFTT